MKLLEGGKDPEETHFDACQENRVDSWTQSIVWILVDDGSDGALATAGGWKIYINPLHLHWCLLSQVFLSGQYPSCNTVFEIVLEPILNKPFLQDDLDWVLGFSELWLYALRSARLALEPTIDASAW